MSASAAPMTRQALREALHGYTRRVAQTEGALKYMHDHRDEIGALVNLFQKQEAEENGRFGLYLILLQLRGFDADTLIRLKLQISGYTTIVRKIVTLGERTGGLDPDAAVDALPVSESTMAHIKVLRADRRGAEEKFIAIFFPGAE